MSITAPRTTLIDVTQPRTGTTRWNATLVVAFSALVAIAAQISIPLPFTPVPVTGQTFSVLLAGALLGSRRGMTALLLYLAEGVAGLPVFALGHSGMATIVGPTGGYLLGLPLAALVVGLLAERGWDRNLLRSIVAMVMGEVVIFACGLLWLSHFVGTGHVLALGLWPFVPGDVAKILLSAAMLPTGWGLARAAHLH